MHSSHLLSSFHSHLFQAISHALFTGNTKAEVRVAAAEALKSLQNTLWTFNGNGGAGNVQKSSNVSSSTGGIMDYWKNDKNVNVSLWVADISQQEEIRRITSGTV